MMNLRKYPTTTNASAALRVCRCCVVAMVVAFAMVIVSCEREPHKFLHHGDDNMELALPLVELELDVYWDYTDDDGIPYDWQSEWFYGWDEQDNELFGEQGYLKPNRFQLRAYNTEEPFGQHLTDPIRDQVRTNPHPLRVEWGYWDFLAWNDLDALDIIQSLYFDETRDSVIAYTEATTYASRYHAPRFTRSYYQPEALFAGYKQGEDIFLETCEWNDERQAFIKNVNMMLYPCTYIYLTQVVLHNNRGRIYGVDGTANLSGMARSVNLNTGVAGRDAISTHYNVRFKPGCDMRGEDVDIVGGRLLTFGMCGVNGSRVKPGKRKGVPYVDDGRRHYMDVIMYFNNGMDSTFVFDVTDQVQKRYKGGVLTVELDVDTISLPSRSGGSGFDAVVEDFEIEDIPEFEM